MYDNMDAIIRLSVSADITPDFLRQLANEIEAREEQEDFDFETADGYAEVEYE